MGCLLDRLPFDYSYPEARELRDLLAGLYYRDSDVFALTDAIGLPRRSVHFGQNSDETWHQLLIDTRSRGTLEMLMGLVLQDEKVVSHHARIEELLRDSPVTSVPETIDAPIEDTDVISPDVLELVERQTGDRSTLIDISLLRGALRVSPAVVRLVVHFGRVPYTATGVCISRNTILTNHHVIYDWDNGERRLTSGVAWLGYETSSGGLVRDPIKLNLTPESAIGDRALDWCVISTHAPIPETFGYLRLPTDSELEVGDAVSIIQHPNGRPKQISLQHNAVVSIAGSTVSYFTDTEEGSSGSPVFDEQWRVVALHKGSGNERIGSARKIVNRGTLIGAVIRGLGNAQVPFETMR